MNKQTNDKTEIIVAIDGPSGVGKSTIARLLAKKLHCHYIDTGAMYRAVALMAQERNVSIEDSGALIPLGQEMKIEFIEEGEQCKIILAGKDVTEDLRRPGVGEAASRLSSLPDVRKVLVDKQRQFGQQGNIVMEGRDIGTVVFPDANLKIFLDADVQERARRRSAQFEQKGIKILEKQISQQISVRDHRDKTRKAAPLVPSHDAIAIDTTHLGINEVLDKIMSLLS